MGFYLELYPLSGEDEYREQAVPKVYWILYGLAGFALTCMFTAAYRLLADLVRMGDPWDLALVGLILSAAPIYFLLGIKMLWIRKFVRFGSGKIGVGFRMGRWKLCESSLPLESIQSVELINRRPSANLAPVQHGDNQYFIRGHWKVFVVAKNGKEIVLDRHTEKEALEPLWNRVKLTFLGRAIV